MEILAAAFVTALSQWLKKHSPNEYVTVFMVIGISVAAAGIFCALQAANFWVETLRILTIAGAIYTFIIQRFEGKADDTATFVTSDLG